MCRPELVQHAWQHIGAHGRRCRDDERADRALPQIREELAPFSDGGDGALGIRKERAPRVGQAHAAMGAHEELDP